MTAVYGAATTLLHREEALNQQQRRQLLEMIESEARRLARITENVLLTSQLDREDLRIKHEAVDVADLVRTTVEAMATRLPDPVLIELDVQTERSAASGDRDRIQQVVTNLLDNAVKYGGANGIAVRIGAENGASASRSPIRVQASSSPTKSESSRSSTARIRNWRRPRPARDLGSTSLVNSSSGWAERCG